MAETALVLSICALALALVAGIRASTRQGQAVVAVRLARLERSVQELRQAAGLPSYSTSPTLPAIAPVPSAAASTVPSGPSQDVLDLIASGNKIAAIKQYREETGAGLKDAKDAVEAIERNGLESTNPGLRINA